MIDHKTQVAEPKNQADLVSTRRPLPPFTRETAIEKVRLAEDGWNSRDPEKVAAFRFAGLLVPALATASCSEKTTRQG